MRSHFSCRRVRVVAAPAEAGGAQRWYEQMRVNLPQALELERRLQAFFAEHITPWITTHRYANAAVDKFLAAIGNWSDIGTRLRWPYRWIDPAEAARLRAAARKQLPELIADDGTR